MVKGLTERRTKRFAFAALATILLVLCAAAILAQGRSGAREKGDKAATVAESKGKLPDLPPPYSEVKREGEGRDYTFFGAVKSFLRIVVSLAIVTALVWAVVWLLKRYGGRNGLLAILAGMRTSSGRGSLRMLETLAIAPGRSVHIIEVGRKLMVIGVTQQSVSLIAEVTDEEEAEQIRRQAFRASPFLRALDEGDATYGPPSAALGDSGSTIRGAAESLMARSRELDRMRHERSRARAAEEGPESEEEVRSRRGRR